MTSTIRVAMIIQAFLPHIGGAERQLAALAPRLRARGVEVSIVTRRYTGMSAYEEIDGTPVYRLPVLGPKPVASGLFTLSALPLLRRLHPHIIHAHELLSPTTTTITAKRLLGRPVIAKVMRGGMLGDLAKVRSKPFGRNRIAMFRRHVDVFIAISSEIDAELEQIGISADRRRFIPNGVDANRFAPVGAAVRARMREQLDLPNSSPVAGFAGRLVPEKRVAQLVELWQYVRTERSDAVLLIAGEGPEEERLRRVAGEGVRFLGRVEEMAPLYQAADLFVLPSATEGLSNALLEAMASGLPVIATRVGGAPDVIDHGQNGWLVAPDTPEDLRSALLVLLQDDDLRERLGQAARHTIARDYGLPAVADRLRALYEEVLQCS